MSQLVEIEAFVAVVRDGSFNAAGEALEVSPSYVSKLVSRLEERLGVALLHRTTRSLTVTEPGRALYETCASSLQSITVALDEAAASQQRLSGTLRITLGTGLGAHWLTEPLVEFMARHPGLSVDLVYLDRFVDLVEEGFDLGIRVGQLRDSTMIARRLTTVTRMLVASPGYLDARGTPARVHDLAEHKCLLYAYHQTPETWTLHHSDQTARVTVSGAVVANNGAALTSMVSAGMGIALLPEFYVAKALREAQLVRVLPEWSSELPVHAVFPNSRHVPAKVRALIEFVSERVATAASS
jgi:DNA-binding transcriptional LysR family regulator